MTCALPGHSGSKLSKEMEVRRGTLVGSLDGEARSYLCAWSEPTSDRSAASPAPKPCWSQTNGGDFGKTLGLDCWSDEGREPHDVGLKKKAASFSQGITGLTGEKCPFSCMSPWAIGQVKF